MTRAESFENTLIVNLKINDIQVYDQRGKLPYREPGWPKIDFSKRRGICFHHSASNNGSWEAYARAHMSRWSRAGTIAYTAGIAKDGSFHIFNDFDRKGYTQGTRDRPGDENELLMGFLVDGSFHSKWNETYVNPTYEQQRTIWAIIQFMNEHSPIRQIAGHFMFGKAACPGDMIKAMVIEYNIYHIKQLLGKTEQLRSDLDLLTEIIEYINNYNILDVEYIMDTKGLQRAIGTKPFHLCFLR